MVTAIDMHDVIIIATDQGVLVAPRSSAQRVKEVVDALKKAGREDLL